MLCVGIMIYMGTVFYVILINLASWVLLAFDGIEWYLFRLLHVPLVLRGHELTIKSIDVNYVLKLS